eukprot:13325535-Ditylum_brightwellii.AAC.1
MERLHLDHNYLFGTIPDDILSLMRLRELKLSHSRQEMECGFSDCNIYPTQYKGGDVCCANENGQIVCSDEAGVELTTNNDFCLSPALRGNIPAGFTNTPYLQVLELSNNLLAGNIPPEISALSRLEVLDVTNNVFTGSIPPALGVLVDAAVLVKGNDKVRGQTK